MSTVKSARPTSRASRARPAQARRSTPPPAALLGLGVVVAALVIFALLRWTGVAPFGSDNDEYPLVATALLDTGQPTVGGVEGTKYPLGYPLLLALVQLLGLPLAATGAVLNILFIVGTVALVVACVRHLESGFATFAAALFTAVNAGVWWTATSLMPDALMALLSAWLLYLVLRMETVRDVILVAVASAVATAVKSVGIFNAGAASAALLLGDRHLRRWFLLPGAAGLVALLGHALLLRPYPEATTGYGRVFWLVNPYDAAEGRAGLGDVVARLWSRADVVAQDWALAVVGNQLPLTAAKIITLALLAAGIWGLGRRWPFGVALVVLYGAGLALWPFSSYRFGLPLVPLAALGVARLAAVTPARRDLRLAVITTVCVALAVHAPLVAQSVANVADTEAVEYQSLHDATAEAVHWLEHNTAEDEAIASHGYRELMRRMDRRVLPASYTRDPAALWAETGGRGADWFVMFTELYPRRVRAARALVRGYPDRFERVFRNDEITIWRVTAG